MNPQVKPFFNQGLAMAVNYSFTSRPNKALEIAAEIRKVVPDYDVGKLVMDYLVAPKLGFPQPDITDFMGQYWRGESLEGKSIQVFCDQGMGDTLNLLRYLQELKLRWNCKIVLNCYSFFNEFERLTGRFSFIDIFTPFHVKCDYHTNIMSVPALLAGLEFDVYYPAHFKELLEQTKIPARTMLSGIEKVVPGERMKVGVAWKSNADNYLAKAKSFPVELLNLLWHPSWDLYSLLPVEPSETLSFVHLWPLKDLEDTAHLIQSMDVVVSVDTVTLHLAGMFSVLTYGLLPFDSDPRWGDDTFTEWYPHICLMRQGEDLDWERLLGKVRERLVLISENL